MDESLKARLIGGAVLVALVVLLVPELLSGRKTSQPEPDAEAGSRATRTYTIDLKGGSPVEVAPAPAVKPVPEERARPEPVAQDPAGAEETEKSTPVAPAPAAAVAEPAPRTPAPAPAKGGWAVQVGAFGSADTARKLVKELGAAGFRAYESPVSRAGKTLHRVRVGPQAARADADSLAVRLKARGLPATVVAND